MESGAYLVVIVYLDRQDLHQHGEKPQSAALQESWFTLKSTKGGASDGNFKNGTLVFLSWEALDI